MTPSYSIGSYTGKMPTRERVEIIYKKLVFTKKDFREIHEAFEKFLKKMDTISR